MSSAPAADIVYAAKEVLGHVTTAVPKSVWALWLSVTKAGSNHLAQTGLQTLELACVC